MKSVLILILYILGTIVKCENVFKEDVTPVKPKLTNKQRLDLQKQQAKQGYQEVVVHVIPHSHDDLGWTRTIDQYWGERVHSIYNSIADVVNEENDRTFTIDGIDYFMMWWRIQDQYTKDRIRSLLQSGRLEIVNGGWSEHDEGAAYYSDMISNMQFGQLITLKEFGFTPKIGWQIDIFGLSETNAKLFADMGLQAIFLNRIDVHERELRREGNELEFLWRPYFQFSGKDTQIFGHLFWHHYSVPEFWKIETVTDNICTAELETEEQWEQFINKMNDWITKMATHHLSNHVLFTAGDDFQYFQNAEENFQFLETVFTLLNEKYPNITWKFSTPSQYLDAISSQDIVYPVKYDDFIPFVDKPNFGTYWVGYYTTRPNLKSQIRLLTALNYGANKIFTQYSLKIERFYDDLIFDILDGRDVLMDAVGMSNHHDTVTGTCRQVVADDYAYRIHNALQESQKEVGKMLMIQTMHDLGLSLGEIKFCDVMNGTYLDCPIGKHLYVNVWVMSIFNPSLKVKPVIKVKAPHPYWVVEGWNTTTRSWQNIFAEALCEPIMLESFEKIVNCDIYIEMEVQALQYAYARLIFDDAFDISIKEQEDYDEVFISNQNITVRYENSDDGSLFTLLNHDLMEEYPFKFDMRYYKSPVLPLSKVPNNYGVSGMYIFVANMSDNNGMSHRYCTVRDFTIFKGRLIQQITFNMRAKVANLVTARVKLERYGEFLDLFYWEVDIHGANWRQLSNEITFNIEALNIDNGEVFYTDSNGLKMQRRQLNHRESYQIRTPQKISSNYFPVASAIAIQNENRTHQMTVMPDRTMGGSVLKSGRVELMLHRRIDGDDQRGGSEHITENNTYGRPIHVRSEIAVQLFNRKQERSLQRQYQIFKDDQLQVFYSFNVTNPQDDHPKIIRSKPFLNHLTQDFLNQIGITDTMKVYIFPLDQNLFTIRIENLDDKFDNPKIDIKTAPQVDLQEFVLEFFKLSNNDIVVYDELGNYEIEMEELGLSGNQAKSDIEELKKQYTWKGADDETLKKREYLKDIKGSERIVVEQMRMRTFLVSINKKQ